MSRPYQLSHNVMTNYRESGRKEVGVNESLTDCTTGSGRVPVPLHHRQLPNATGRRIRGRRDLNAVG